MLGCPELRAVTQPHEVELPLHLSASVLGSLCFGEKKGSIAEGRCHRCGRVEKGSHTGRNGQGNLQHTPPAAGKSGKHPNVAQCERHRDSLSLSTTQRTTLTVLRCLLSRLHSSQWLHVHRGVGEIQGSKCQAGRPDSAKATQFPTSGVLGCDTVEATPFFFNLIANTDQDGFTVP